MRGYRNTAKFAVILLISGLTNTANAIDTSSVDRWDRSSAMAAVRSVNIDPAVTEIGDLSSLSNGTITIARLEALANRGDWPMPAREAAIYQFTRSLATLPRNAVDQDVIKHLRTYRARVLVPHEEHGDGLVPLFNIRAAAAGVSNGWLLAESRSEALAWLDHDPAALPGNYLKLTSHSHQSAYLDVLKDANRDQAQTIQSMALSQLRQSPGLTAVVAATAVITLDPSATRELLLNGRGAGLAQTLKTLADRQDVSTTAALLKFAIEQAPTENAAMAISSWWPALRNDDATRQLLTNRLSDDALGSSAALALAQSPDVQTIHELQRIAQGDSTAARRAQLALSINRDLLNGEAQK